MFDYTEAKRRAIETRQKRNRSEITDLELKYEIAKIYEEIHDAYLAGEKFKRVKIKTDRDTINAIWIDMEPPERNQRVTIETTNGYGNIAYQTNIEIE